MSYNFLIVDDSRTMRDAIMKTLRIAEVPIENLYEASNGQEGLDVLHAHWIDLIFSDINMPVMNGTEMIDRMRNDDLLKSTPVVVISTVGNTKVIENLMLKGIHAYLRKPMTPETLREIVAQVLDGKDAAEPEAVLASVFPEVVEKCAFMFAEAVASDGLSCIDDEIFHVKICFNGEREGNISVAISKAMCVEIAANVLGVDPAEDIAAARSEDAIMELLNIVCGHFLTRFAGEHATFSQLPPQCDPMSKEAWMDFLGQSETKAFEIDEHLVLLRLSLEDVS